MHIESSQLLFLESKLVVVQCKVLNNIETVRITRSVRK